jgi:hypothetical protein
VRRRPRDPYGPSLRERIARRIGEHRRRDWVVAALAAVALAVAGYALSVAGGAPTAKLHGWESGVRVAVAGRAAGSCASAYPPWQYLLTADQWIVCAVNPGYACYRQRMHAIQLKAQPIRPSRFDADCRSALAVLRKSGLLR